MINKNETFSDVATVARTYERLKADNIPVSMNALRCWVKQEKFPATFIGRKVLLYYPNVVEFIKTGESKSVTPMPTPISSVTRRVPGIRAINL